MQDQEVLDKICDVAAKLFRKKELNMQRQTVAGDVDGWDSLSHALLMLRLESTFGIKFNDADLCRVQCVGDLIHLVQATKSSLKS